MPECTNDWFRRDAKLKFEKYLLGMRVDDYLEIGVAEGESMLWVLENLQPQRAIGVDWWKAPSGNKRRDDVFKEYKKTAHRNLAPFIEQGVVQLVQDSSTHFMANCEQTFDLIYVDGDHSGSGAMRDFLLAYELLKTGTHKRELATGVMQKVGGTMVVDDLQRSTSRKGRYEVRLAVDLFAALMMGRVMKLWEDGRQCAFIRIG